MLVSRNVSFFISKNVLLKFLRREEEMEIVNVDLVCITTYWRKLFKRLVFFQLGSLFFGEIKEL